MVRQINLSIRKTQVIHSFDIIDGPDFVAGSEARTTLV
jgi:hypothetical protein